MPLAPIAGSVGTTPAGKGMGMDEVLKVVTVIFAILGVALLVGMVISAWRHDESSRGRWWGWW
jgi:hypothetical protein